jgi:hypothetical protein
LFSLISTTVLVEIGLALSVAKDALQVLLNEMGAVISKKRPSPPPPTPPPPPPPPPVPEDLPRRAIKNRVRLYWDVDNIALPNENLDSVIQSLRHVHVAYLDWPEKEVVDFKLRFVCNKCTHDRIGEGLLRIVERAGLSFTVVPNDKEATDRKIERSMNKEIAVRCCPLAP